VLRVRERTPTPFPSVVFTFRLAVESTKELGGASTILAMVALNFSYLIWIICLNLQLMQLLVFLRPFIILPTNFHDVGNLDIVVQH
jgi:hypothetical protein